MKIHITNLVKSNRNLEIFYIKKLIIITGLQITIIGLDIVWTGIYIIKTGVT